MTALDSTLLTGVAVLIGGAATACYAWCWYDFFRPHDRYRPTSEVAALVVFGTLLLGALLLVGWIAQALGFSVRS